MAVKKEKRFSGEKQGPSCLPILRDIYLSRFLDEKMFKLSRQNKGAALQLSAEGHEIIGVTFAHALEAGKDWGFPYYRDQPFGVGIGCKLVELLGAFLSRAIPRHSSGRMMPAHFADRDLRLPTQSSVVGSQILQATGLAKAIKTSGKNEVVYVSFGDGATSQGDFHEALNYSCIHKLPVIFVVQDNAWAISVPAKEQTSGESVANYAKSYTGLASWEVDGCDFPSMQTSVKEAVEHARSKGPVLFVAHVPRLAPHSNSDNDKKYKTEDNFVEDRKRDPVSHMEDYLLKKKIAKKDEIEALKKECFDRVEEAALEAEKLPFPDPETVEENVFFPGEEISDSAQLPEEGEEVVMIDAINHALKEEMERDSRIVVFGQDVARSKGGVFGASQGLTETFGDDRCFNTPLAESTIVGTAIGMSLHESCVPVAEVQFADYLWTGINQLFNELSSFCYRSNGVWNCPLVLRMPTGGYIQGGPYHSQNIEGFLAHCPGLKIVYPSNAADAKMLLKSAVRDPNPVIFLEHKALYRQRKFSARKEPSKTALLPLGKAELVREGSDLSIITWGMMTAWAVELADRLKRVEDVSIEVIDARTLVPFDWETVFQSVEKTGKALIVHEACRTGGFGGEIAAEITEKRFEFLDAPVQRYCALDCPVPYAKVLEEAMLPSLQGLEERIRDLLAY